MSTLNIENKKSFLVRQITVKANSNEELFKLLENAISKKPVQVIATPRIDLAGHMYYWLGVRFDRFELDYKLLVNEQIKNYIHSYLRGDAELPAVTDFNPLKVEDEITQWMLCHETEHSMSAIQLKEEISISNGQNYLNRKLIFRNGKIIYPSAEVTDILSLIMVE